MSEVDRIFLLSPAHCDGKRARMLLREGASFALANRLREAGGDVVGGPFGRGHRDYHADGQRGDKRGRGWPAGEPTCPLARAAIVAGPGLLIAAGRRGLSG